jgi:hypothetical protein
MGQGKERGNEENNEEALRYTVLLYEEPGMGLWGKIKEYGLQCSGDCEEAVFLCLEESLQQELWARRHRGERIPGLWVRSVEYVGREEYGPTEVDLIEKRMARDPEEEYGDDT